MMPESEKTEILVAIARLEGKVDALAATDTRAEGRLDAHSRRLDKLERIAYVALGMAAAAGLPQIAALIN